jgi:predicted nucleic acid-binding protein
LIVVDASVLAPALSGAGRASRVATLAMVDEELHAPHLIDVEIVAALRSLVARGTLTQGRAEAAMADLDRLRVTRYPLQPFLPRVWGLRPNVSPYDACYVALAEALEVRLVTADGRLARAPGVACEVWLLT